MEPPVRDCGKMWLWLQMSHVLIGMKYISQLVGSVVPPLRVLVLPSSRIITQVTRSPPLSPPYLSSLLSLLILILILTSLLASQLRQDTGGSAQLSSKRVQGENLIVRVG